MLKRVAIPFSKEIYLTQGSNVGLQTDSLPEAPRNTDKAIFLLLGISCNYFSSFPFLDSPLFLTHLQYTSSLSSSTSVQYGNPLSLSPKWLTRTVFFLTGLLAPTPASVQSILYIEARVIVLKWNHRDFPGGPVAKTARSMQRAWVRSLVRELEPSCCNQEFTCRNYRSYIFQLRPGTAK